MTLFQIFIRFLKDNNLYGYYFNSKHKDSNGKLTRKPFTNKDYFQMCVARNPYKAFSYAFSYDTHFYGNSTSVKRKKYYSLNKKWKNLLKKHVFVQTNIEEGDIFHDKNGVDRYKVIRLLNPFVIETEHIHFQYHVSKRVYDIDIIENKNLVHNLYIKDRKGNCYGKIDGEYNEIQL